MKYRIVKMKVFPEHLENIDAPMYSIECKRHFWSKWRPLETDTDMNGKTVPKLYSLKQIVSSTIKSMGYKK